MEHSEIDYFHFLRLQYVYLECRYETLVLKLLSFQPTLDQPISDHPQPYEEVLEAYSSSALQTTSASLDSKHQKHPKDLLQVSLLNLKKLKLLKMVQKMNFLYSKTNLVSQLNTGPHLASPKLSRKVLATVTGTELASLLLLRLLSWYRLLPPSPRISGPGN